MENISHKKNTCVKKMFEKNAFKNVGFTYKSQIIKSKIQQKVFNKIISTKNPF